jgi:uncharacterized circularly permuted ATP-grasp superfamily protein
MITKSKTFYVSDDNQKDIDLCVEASMNPIKAAGTMINLAKGIKELEARNKLLEELLREIYNQDRFNEDYIDEDLIEKAKKLLGKG